MYMLCILIATDAMESSAMMAEQGNVDGSMAAATAAEDLQKQYDALYKELTANDRFMTVCEVCGVFINSTDNEQRRQVRSVQQGIHVIPTTVVINAGPLGRQAVPGLEGHSREACAAAGKVCGACSRGWGDPGAGGGVPAGAAEYGPLTQPGAVVAVSGALAGA